MVLPTVSGGGKKGVRVAELPASARGASIKVTPTDPSVTLPAVEGPWTARAPRSGGAATGGGGGWDATTFPALPAAQPLGWEDAGKALEAHLKDAYGRTHETLRIADLQRDPQLRKEMAELPLSAYFDPRGAPRFRRLGLSFAARQNDSVRAAFGNWVDKEKDGDKEKKVQSAKAYFLASEAIEKDSIFGKIRQREVLETLDPTQKVKAADVHRRQLEVMFSEIPDFAKHLPPGVKESSLLPVEVTKEDERANRSLNDRTCVFLTDRAWRMGAKMEWGMTRGEVLYITLVANMWMKATRGSASPVGMERPTFCRMLLDWGVVDQERVPFFWAVSLFDEAARPMRYLPPREETQPAPVLPVVSRWSLVTVLDTILRQLFADNSSTKHSFFVSLLPLAKMRLPAWVVEESGLKEDMVSEYLSNPNMLITGGANGEGGLEAFGVKPDKEDRPNAERPPRALASRASDMSPMTENRKGEAAKEFRIRALLCEPEVIHLVTQYSELFKRLFACYAPKGNMPYPALLQFCTDFRITPVVASAAAVKQAYETAQCVDRVPPAGGGRQYVRVGVAMDSHQVVAMAGGGQGARGGAGGGGGGGTGIQVAGSDSMHDTRSGGRQARIDPNFQGSGGGTSQSPMPKINRAALLRMNSGGPKAPGQPWALGPGREELQAKAARGSVVAGRDARADKKESATARAGKTGPADPSPSPRSAGPGGTPTDPAEPAAAPPSPTAPPQGPMGRRPSGIRQSSPSADSPFIINWPPALPWAGLLEFASQVSALGKALRVVIESARGLRSVDRGDPELFSDKVDSFCKCYIKGKEGHVIQTEVANNTLEPVWNFEGRFPEYEPGDSLEFCVCSNGKAQALKQQASAATGTPGGPPASSDVLARGSLAGNKLKEGFAGDLVMDMLRGPPVFVKLRVKYVSADPREILMGKQVGTFGVGAFTESLLRLAFSYLGSYGTMQQQTSSGLARTVWLLTYLKSAMSHLRESVDKRARNEELPFPLHESLAKALQLPMAEIWAAAPDPKSPARLAPAMCRPGLPKDPLQSKPPKHKASRKEPDHEKGAGAFQAVAFFARLSRRQQQQHDPATQHSRRSDTEGEEDGSDGDRDEADDMPLRPMISTPLTTSRRPSVGPDKEKEAGRRGSRIADAAHHPAPAAVEKPRGVTTPMSPSQRSHRRARESSALYAEAQQLVRAPNPPPPPTVPTQGPCILDGRCQLCGGCAGDEIWGSPTCRGCSAVDVHSFRGHPLRALMIDWHPLIKPKAPPAVPPAKVERALLTPPPLGRNDMLQG